MKYRVIIEIESNINDEEYIRGVISNLLYDLHHPSFYGLKIKKISVKKESLDKWHRYVPAVEV